MRNKKAIVTLYLLINIVLPAVTMGQDAPQVLSIEPAQGSADVDPDLSEILVTFDRAMGSGMSVMGTPSAPDYPRRAHWRDETTYVIPVSLRSNMLYTIQLNDSYYGNFRSKEGVSLEPYTIRFRTTKTPESKKLNRASYSQFQEHFNKYYSYFYRTGTDWEERFKSFEERFMKADSRSEFALHLLEFLEPANDPHLWVQLDGARLNTHAKKAMHLNQNLNAIVQKLSDKKVSPSAQVISGVLDSTAYIAIRSWDGVKSEEILTSVDRLKELSGYPNLIVDVRDNGGGNDAIARQFATHFISENKDFEKVVRYNESTADFDREQVNEIVAGNPDERYTGNVYLLIGNAVMSSNESFVLMMSQGENVKTVGMPTYGSSGNPKPYELDNGITIYLPSWRAYTMEDQLIEGNGLQPDVLIKTSAADFKNGDMLLDKVLEMIKSSEIR